MVSPVQRMVQGKGGWLIEIATCRNSMEHAELEDWATVMKRTKIKMRIKQKYWSARDTHPPPPQPLPFLLVA